MPTYHIHQSHVQKHPGRDGKDPVGHVVRVLAHGRADHHANIGHERRQQVVDDGLLHRHPSLQQNRKVTWRQKHPGEITNRMGGSNPSRAERSRKE